MATTNPDWKPELLSKPDVVPAVWGALRTPAPAEPPHPGVILLPGSSGWKSAYAQVAGSLASAGLVALALDYHAETGTHTSDEDLVRKLPLWQATIRNAVRWLQAAPSVSGRQIGLVGYSLGAFLAVSVAASLPAVAAVVDFFGGGNPSPDRLAQEVSKFPPLLILHGQADTVVPVDAAFRLRDAVVAHGGHVEMHIYPEAGHGFNAPWSPMYSESEASDSLKRATDFLRSFLAR